MKFQLARLLSSRRCLAVNSVTIFLDYQPVRSRQKSYRDALHHGETARLMQLIGAEAREFYATFFFFSQKSQRRFIIRRTHFRGNINGTPRSFQKLRTAANLPI